MSNKIVNTVLNKSRVKEPVAGQLILIVNLVGNPVEDATVVAEAYRSFVSLGALGQLGGDPPTAGVTIADPDGLSRAHISFSKESRIRLPEPPDEHDGVMVNHEQEYTC